VSGETEKSVSGWTVDTLNAHVRETLIERDRRYEQRFAAQEHALAERDLFLERLAAERDKQVAAAFNASSRAIEKAEIANEKRLDGMNEFRSTLSDQARDLMPRAETEALVHAIEEKLVLLTKQMDRMAGERGGTAQTIGFSVGAVGVLIALAAIVVAIVLH